MAQGVAWSARHFGVPCTVVVPEHAPQTKVDAVERLGGRVVKVPFDRWWQTLVDHSYPGIDGLFVHPVSDPAVIAGNGTIGLEIVEDLPDVDTVLVPFGGGGLSSGIATAVRALRPDVKVFGCEVATSTPLTSALAAGEPVRVVRSPSFIDGIGGNGVLSEMWPLVSTLLAGALVSSVEQVAAAVRLLLERARVVAEGAGAASLAAALGHRRSRQGRLRRFGREHRRREARGDSVWRGACMIVLVLNAGSSSLKFQLVRTDLIASPTTGREARARNDRAHWRGSGFHAPWSRRRPCRAARRRCVTCGRPSSTS